MNFARVVRAWVVSLPLVTVACAGVPTVHRALASAPPAATLPASYPAAAPTLRAPASLLERRLARAQDAAPATASAPQYASGFALSIYGVRHAIGGDFNGQNAVVSPFDLTVLPDLDAGLGLGAALGLKSPGGSFDLYFESTEHDGKFGGASFDTSLVNFGVRGRFVPGRFDSPTQRWQPYFLAGVALSFLSVENGSTDGTNLDDGDLLGFSCELGLGGLVNLSEHIALRLDLGYRWTEFSSIDSIAFSGTIDGGVDGDGLWTALGLVLTL